VAEEKIAVVTGSSSGIGLLTAIELALNGYRVVATMRDLERRTRLVEAAQKAGTRERIEMRRLNITEFDSLPGAGRVDRSRSRAHRCAGEQRRIQCCRFRRKHDAR